MLHNPFYTPAPEYQGISNDESMKTVEKAIKVVKPEIVFCGHLHATPYTVHRFDLGTLYIRVDSSQQHRHYTVLHLDNMRVEIW